MFRVELGSETDHNRDLKSRGKEGALANQPWEQREIKANSELRQLFKGAENLLR